MDLKKIDENYIRSLMFGLQDGIVSTTGVVVGISVGVQDKTIIVLAALVAVMVEATSMAAGQYNSEKAVHQMDRKNRHTDNLILGAIIMFFAYLIGGSFSIVPTLIFNQPEAKIIAIISALIGLVIIGYAKGKYVENKPIRSALELLIIGGLATLIGVVVGYFLKV
jgi:vacuolar iron transporter family protein